MTGEIGTIKHEIVFLGDTLNTAARIEQAGKGLQRPFLASGAVVSAIDLPDEVAIDGLGQIELRGVEEPVELFAVTRVAAPPTTA